MADTVTARLFAAAADAAATEEVELSASTVGEVHEGLAERFGEPLRSLLPRCSFLADGVAATTAEHPVRAQVDVLPPFAGG